MKSAAVFQAKDVHGDYRTRVRTYTYHSASEKDGSDVPRICRMISCLGPFESCVDLSTISHPPRVSRSAISQFFCPHTHKRRPPSFPPNICSHVCIYFRFSRPVSRSHSVHSVGMCCWYTHTHTIPITVSLSPPNSPFLHFPLLHTQFPFSLSLTLSLSHGVQVFFLSFTTTTTTTLYLSLSLRRLVVVLQPR